MLSDQYQTWGSKREKGTLRVEKKHQLLIIQRTDSFFFWGGLYLVLYKQQRIGSITLAGRKMKYGHIRENSLTSRTWTFEYIDGNFTLSAKL